METLASLSTILGGLIVENEIVKCYTPYISYNQQIIMSEDGPGMKILFYRTNCITEEAIMEQFTYFGFETESVSALHGSSKAVPFDVGSHALCEDISVLEEHIRSSSYTFLFSLNFYPELSALCESHAVPYVCWNIDAPNVSLFSKEITNSCNRIFSFDKKQFEDISKYNKANAFHLPLGADISRLNRITDSITSADISKYSSDISFVGSLYNEKNPVLGISSPSQYLTGFIDGLVNVQADLQNVNIFSRSLTPKVLNELKEKLPAMFTLNSSYIEGTERFIAAHHILGAHCANIEREYILCLLSEQFTIDLYTGSNTDCFNGINSIHCHGYADSLIEVPKIYNLSKINLNISNRATESGASQRIWDVLGSKGFLLTNYREGLSEYLVAGVDYDFYTDYGDLIEKCRFYLENEEVRREIALNGYETVKRHHTFSDRISNMVKRIM